MSESLHSPVSEHGVHRRHLHVVPSAYSTAQEAPASPVPAWAKRLSNREVDVLQCIAEGLSTTEIAETLFISKATVKSHIARLIMKVEVRDRLELVVVAYRSGFIRVS